MYWIYNNYGNVFAFFTYGMIAGDQIPAMKKSKQVVDQFVGFILFVHR